MDSLKRMNDALGFIEDHLTEEIDYRKVAKVAACSEYHFKRMFSFLSGISLSEYIRRRRLSLAASDLKDRRLRVLDVAVKYGYQSADAFSRAFYTLHGIHPSEVRRQSTQMKAYPRMTFQLSIQGGDEMNYRIVEKEAFRIIGFKKRVPIVFEGVNPEIEKMNKLLTKKAVEELLSLSDMDPGGIISASANFSEGRMEEKGELDHYIGVASTKGSEDYDVLQVPAGTWAIFETVGPFPQALQETWGRIYSEWFPSSGYESVEGPEILSYGKQAMDSPEFTAYIYIPVKKF